jgi:hypothetical protein
MRIGFVCYWNLLQKDGIAKKISGQVRTWRALGHEAEIFCVSRAREVRTDWRVFSFEGGLRTRWKATQALQEAVIEYRPDVVYARLDHYLPPLGRISRALPTVLEVQAKDWEEIRLRTGGARRAQAYNAFSRRALFGRACGFVGVTRELAELPLFERYHLPSIAIGNGVDLDLMRELPPPVHPRPALAFLGSVNQDWHGVDKILRLADSLPEVDFHLVGYAPGDLGREPPPNATAHGVLSREEYEPILAGSDAGIGTLALHRKLMEEASPLKVREYLGYGLPIVIAYEDTDLMGFDPWFVLRLPNEETNVETGLGEIRAFVERVRGRRVPREEVEKRIGWHGKERRRLEFVARCAGLLPPEEVAELRPDERGELRRDRPVRRDAAAQ